MISNVKIKARYLHVICTHGIIRVIVTSIDNHVTTKYTAVPHYGTYATVVHTVFTKECHYFPKVKISHRISRCFTNFINRRRRNTSERHMKATNKRRDVSKETK